MSDIKSVLSLLCQHLNFSIDVTMKPEHFRLAKFNGASENINEIFWRTLNALSYCAAKEKEIEVDFKQCDTVSATKLYFAYLRYPAIEFYASSERSKNSRPLLLAFAWLLGTENVLNTVTRINVSQSVLGREYSRSNATEKTEIECSIPDTVPTLINNILCLNGKVNYNIKEISGLITEQTKLASKAHTASINVSGLPHLSVSEVALIKRITTINKNSPSSEDKQYMKELSTTTNLLDTHMKWLKKEHIFFEWMVTVVEEHNKTLSSSLEDLDWNEVSKFISLLHCMTQGRFETVSLKEHSKNVQDYKANCVSRLLKSQDSSPETEVWLTQMCAEMDKHTEDLTKMKEKLSEGLKKILQSIPSCVQVSF